MNFEMIDRIKSKRVAELNPIQLKKLELVLLEEVSEKEQNNVYKNKKNLVKEFIGAKKQRAVQRELKNTITRF